MSFTECFVAGLGLGFGVFGVLIVLFLSGALFIGIGYLCGLDLDK